jgi:parvulin-like peptidyl-prolyl isomerase
MKLVFRLLGLASLAGPGLVLTGCVAPPSSVALSRDSLATDLTAEANPRLARLQQPEVKQPIRPVANPVLVPEPPGMRLGKNTRLTVRAYVNGKPIFDEEIMQSIDMRGLGSLPEPQRSERLTEVFNKALDHIVERELLYQDAIKKLEQNNPKALDKLRAAATQEFDKKWSRLREINKMTDEQLREAIRAQGVTYEAFKRKEEREFISMEYLRSRIFPLIKVSNQDIRDYYDQHLNEFQRLDSVKWQDVFIAVGPKHPTLADARRFAETLVARSRAGEDFSKLIQYDDGDSKYRGGEGLGNFPGQIKPPELENYLFSMMEGEIGPVVELSTGVHIFRLLKREYAGQLPFDETIQGQIRSKLRNEIAQREQQRIVREIRNRSIIEIDQQVP